eukprot:TRINITY_DN11305_c1_g2_i1.p1 TRINITY_DN11305_c1_g2~~TRINITY_DN11305_c1_g2_i1.p1  ORF type:complete len:109 (+),score=31.85 TRINITY_DN11305_c1_g2_i1:2-328(+)
MQTMQTMHHESFIRPSILPSFLVNTLKRLREDYQLFSARRARTTEQPIDITDSDSDSEVAEKTENEQKEAEKERKEPKEENKKEEKEGNNKLKRRKLTSKNKTINKKK